MNLLELRTRQLSNSRTKNLVEKNDDTLETYNIDTKTTMLKSN